MTEISEDRRLFREAADLAIRLQNDPTNPVAIEMVRSWSARSPQHAATWARVAEIHGMTGKILKEQRRAAKGDAVSRRSLLIGGVIAVGAIGAGSLAIPRAVLYARADYITSTGEIRRVALQDGSVLTLGPDSAVAINYMSARRRIQLLAGMAYFEVEPDTTRPFVVECGSLLATAVGTAYDVSNDAGFVSVSVDRGIVEALAPDSELTAGERLNAGDWITLDPSTRRLTRGTREESQIAAWRTGMLVAEKETVSAMVAKIARWQPGRVVMADPSLGSRVVSGVFDLSDPLRALDAVVRPFGAKVRRIGSLMTVISPI